MTRTYHRPVEIVKHSLTTRHHETLTVANGIKTNTKNNHENVK